MTWLKNLIFVDAVTEPGRCAMMDCPSLLYLKGSCLGENSCQIYFVEQHQMTEKGGVCGLFLLYFRTEQTYKNEPQNIFHRVDLPIKTYTETVV